MVDGACKVAGADGCGLENPRFSRGGGGEIEREEKSRGLRRASEAIEAFHERKV